MYILRDKLTNRGTRSWFTLYKYLSNSSENKRVQIKQFVNIFKDLRFEVDDEKISILIDNYADKNGLD